MMRINFVAAQPDRVGRYIVRFEDGSVMRLYRQTLEDYGIYAGTELSETQCKKLREAAGTMSAKMRAVRIVAASNVSKRDLEKRLIHKGETPKDAQRAVRWMEDLNLLDDYETARQVVASCIRKGYGVSRAKQALYEKRIPQEYWEQVLKDYPDQQEAIIAYLQAHLPGRWEQKDLRRVTDALIRRGHSFQQIRKGLDALSFNTDDFLED